MRIFLLIFLSAFGLQAANYYVDFIGGSDANNGTSTTTPFQRCPGDANATGTAASTTLAAGDTVRFKGGITYIGQIQISVSGATNNLISYVGNFDNGWGAGDSIIDGDATYYHAFETTAGEDFIRIDGLSMRNQKNNLNYANAIVDRAGITITNTYAGSGLITDLGVIRAYQGSRWWWIQNCHIYELENWEDRSVTNAEPDGVDATIEDVPCQQQTIYWYGSSGNPNYGLTVSNCTFRGVGTAGIFIYRASQSLIVSNDFGDVTQARTNRGWFSVAARVTDYCTNTVIVGNKTHNGWQYEGDDEYQRSHAGDWWHIYGSAQPPIDFTFAWNKAWNDEIFTSNRGTSDGIYISDGTLNFYLRSNIFANPHPLRVIYIGSGSCDYTYIEHNTILSESLSDGASTHIRIDSTHGPNLVIRNNASGVKDNLGLHIQDLRTSFAGTIDYNAYYSAANSTAWRNSGYVNFSTWQTWTGGEANSLVGALGLTSWPASAEDYIDLDATPAEGSALIGAASDGGDIGAIPFSDEPPPPPPLTIVTNNASGARVSGFMNLGMSVLPRNLTTATDTFDRADEDPLATTMSDGVSTWSVGPGNWENLEIVSNEAVNANIAASSGAAAVATSPTFSANQSVSIVLGSTVGGQILIVRGDSLLEAGYAVGIDDSDTIVFSQLFSGSHMSLSTLSVVNGLSLSAGETVTLTVTGSGPVELKAYNDGVEIGSYTDSSGVVTGGQPGVAVWENSLDGGIASWSATDL